MCSRQMSSSLGKATSLKLSFVERDYYAALANVNEGALVKAFKPPAILFFAFMFVYDWLWKSQTPPR